MNKKKGFTLIELLVVIAIIGILAAIVLVSLTGARNKAKDARIQSEISQIRAIAEMIWDDDGKYDALEDGATGTITTTGDYGAELSAIESDINTQGGTNPLPAQAASDEYCVYSVLNDTDWFCIDSTGKAAKQGATNPSTTCDGTTFVCP